MELRAKVGTLTKLHCSPLRQAVNSALIKSGECSMISYYPSASIERKSGATGAANAKNRQTALVAFQHLPLTSQKKYSRWLSPSIGLVGTGYY
jgi:hypothetical protein